MTQQPILDNPRQGVFHQPSPSPPSPTCPRRFAKPPSPPTLFIPQEANEKPNYRSQLLVVVLISPNITAFIFSRTMNLFSSSTTSGRTVVGANSLNAASFSNVNTAKAS